MTRGGTQTPAITMARVRSIAFVGMETAEVEVQVHVAAGLPAFTLVGLPDKAVGESRERVRASLSALGLALPPRRVTVNLAPADLAKEGSHFDLPIALGLLIVMGVLPADVVDGQIVLGELALDGSIQPVSGVLAAAIAAAAKGRGLICPAASGGEAAWLASEIPVLAPPTLLSLLDHARGLQVLHAPEPRPIEEPPITADLAEVKGQETAKRALEIAAAGGHNMLMIGPPGAGKSMLAARLPGILPPLDAAEVLEVGMIHSLSGRLVDGRLSRRRPFRAPHHTASMAAMVGGGPQARPGEIALAHHGVLFLDELPEFQRPVLEALRQPLETGQVHVARAAAHVTWPARFQLIAAMNPCRCGHLDNPALACPRAPRCAADYQNRVSGPLLDRIDLVIELASVTAADLELPPPAEGSREVAARVAAARAVQAARFEALGRPDLKTNARADGAVLETIAPLDATCRALLKRAAESFHLTARSWHRLIRVARTIADLDGAETIRKVHLAEAIAYRRRPPPRG
ncbi:MAG: YifB family Mg chelatase-like AAA ATPase [Geminicoccaceae bacterium]|nr:YifB family Mg chelatase-like AAA ATPase [Geminicoccaceae bacterium]MCX8099787.1 YifB family Mg chelatase-like AAA ATPase [Geminicoccaceae bacterium]MDW8368793.1 YifB family Mg chelatase-like AAA ATPase [Geminicoccaceae bacterium]